MPSAPHLPRGERVYAIGDVHGCAGPLAELLAAIRRDNDDRTGARVRIILVGDLVDRGPASADVVARCRSLAARHDRFIVLKGNHEAVMVDALQGSFPAFDFWLQHGGDTTLASWGVSSDLVAEGPSSELMAAARARVSSETIGWLTRLPLSHQRGNCVFVHAGIRPGIPLAKQAATDLLWIRDDFIDSAVPHPHVVVHGHTIEEGEPVLRHGRLGIDTGAYRTGRLTAVGIEGDRYWTLSTGSLPAIPDQPGEVPTIGDSVDAILNAPDTNAARPDRSGVTRPMLVTAAAGMLLVIGTVALLENRGGVGGPTGTPVAVAPPPSTSSRAGTVPPPAQPTANGAPVPPSAIATSRSAARIETADGDAPDRLARDPPSRVPSGNARVARQARAGDRPPAQVAANSGVVAASGTRPDLPLPPERVVAARPDASDDSRASLATDPSTPGALQVPPDGPVVIGRPVPGQGASSGDTRERVKAVDAIRSLRRQ